MNNPLELCFNCSEFIEEQQEENSVIQVLAKI